MSKKTSRGGGSKVASTSSSAAQKSQQSSIQRSSFAPSYLQLALFASVIQGLDSQHLRIHDTNTGRLRCDHAATAKARISSLEWGCYGPSYRESLQQASKKKRKRTQALAEHAVVAYGTSSSGIYMFSVAEGKVVGTLRGVHERGIRDFKFVTDDYLQAWSIGGDGKLVHWDLNTDQATRTISLPDSNITTLASPVQTAPELLCGSLTPFSISLPTEEQPQVESFDSFLTPIQSLFRSGTDNMHEEEMFLASDHDRTITIFDIAQKKLVRSLLAESEPSAVDFYTPPPGTKNALSGQLLAVVTKAGLVELFEKPFVQPKPLVNGDVKMKKSNIPRKANAKVRLVRPNSTTVVPILNTSLQGPELLIAAVDGGVNVTFQKIRWQDEGNGELLFDGIKDVKHVVISSTLNTATLNGVKDMGRAHVDESKAVVVNGAMNGNSHMAAIEILSSDGEDEVDEDEIDEDEIDEDEIDEDEIDEDEVDEDEVDMEGRSKNAGSEETDSDSGEVENPTDVMDTNQDRQMILADNSEKEEAENEEPSFGELLAQKQLGTISIADTLPKDSSAIVQIADNKEISVPSGVSLSTVLTQALRTNDNNLLESCLHTSGTEIIKLTIQRMDSSLAGILLEKLAERLASKPGRYGHLMVWAQWTCIAHGGAIAGRPDVLSKIGTLYKVLSQRAKSLDSLLLLKGKLDMLDAQLTLRKELQARRGARRQIAEAGVIYVEDDDNWSSDEEDAINTQRVTSTSKKPRKTLNELVQKHEKEHSEDDSSEDDGEMLTINNGIPASESDAASESEADSEEESPHQEKKTNKGKLAIFDLEAEEEDSHPSDDEEDSSEEEEEDSDEVDSEMDNFINDGSVEEEDDVDDIIVEEEEEEEEDTLVKPAKKKSRKA